MKNSVRYILFVLFICGMPVITVSQSCFDVDVNSGEVYPVDSYDVCFEGNPPFARCFMPADSLRTGCSVVALPGGGYGGLVFRQGGYDWASFFNKKGISLFVLHYRFPEGDCRRPIADVRKMFDLIKRNALEWRCDTAQMGIMGFSAGGHLAAVMATHPEFGVLPGFQVLFYPVITMDEAYTDKGSRERFLGMHPSPETVEFYSCEKQVDKTTPPAILLLGGQDGVVSSLNALNYYKALLEKGVPAALHAYPSYWHGWGLHDGFPYVEDACHSLSVWLDECILKS